jgi:hypothetical protein
MKANFQRTILNTEVVTEKNEGGKTQFWHFSMFFQQQQSQPGRRQDN